jgi:hypothetical protein
MTAQLRLPRMLHRAVALAGLAAAFSGAPAMADSLTFIRHNNVWLANPDGTGAYQVTRDGSAASPYESPSEANDGTVVAVRAAPGHRRQIYRMTQSGLLRNAPVNTPAPGSGALDAKVSPDGALVAYWFATTVATGRCTFCVSAASQTLLSHSDRFTNPGAVGTPHTGGWPSWLSRDTITLGSGSPTQWYYRLGMPEAAEWFADSDVTGGTAALLDAETAPTGDRLAVVRGNNQETILLLNMNGPPPAKPTIANPTCDALASPHGKFVDPTWSHDGRLLAWQENDGVWVMPVPANLADCGSFGTPALRIPGASAPDLSPAAIHPGARPVCGNPGNPAPCRPTSAPCCSPAQLRAQLKALLSAEATALKHLKLHGLRSRRQVKITFNAPTPGRLMLKLTVKPAKRKVTLATGQVGFTTAGRRTITLRVTRDGAGILRHAHRLNMTLHAAFTPAGGKATRASASLTMPRRAPKRG